MLKTLVALFAFIFCSAVIAQQSMNNDAVVKLVKAGLSDDVVVATVSSSAGTYDTSADALVALKQAGVSDKVIAAMIMHGAGSAAPAAAAPMASGSGLPAGIDEVGVYYKDKTGAWVALMPEIVNFKTGGFLKTLATDGIVKGDINGHVNGAKAKVEVTFPVQIAVYTPEGTAITEYQLLRFRTHSDGREFRSVTGGVIHSSGGASRDTVDFTPTKLAPRVYQITLDAAMGKGEYGLLPPGAVSSSNMASGGKVYSVSILE